MYRFNSCCCFRCSSLRPLASFICCLHFALALPWVPLCSVISVFLVFCSNFFQVFLESFMLGVVRRISSSSILTFFVRSVRSANCLIFGLYLSTVQYFNKLLVFIIIPDFFPNVSLHKCFLFLPPLYLFEWCVFLCWSTIFSAVIISFTICFMTMFIRCCSRFL